MELRKVFFFCVFFFVGSRGAASTFHSHPSWRPTWHFPPHDRCHDMDTPLLLPRKLTMTMEKQAFEDVSPKDGDFPLSC